MGKLSQADRVLFHLLNGKSLTPLEALDMFKVMRLGGRIYELRKKGWKIRTDIINDGEKRYANYVMGDSI